MRKTLWLALVCSSLAFAGPGEEVQRLSNWLEAHPQEVQGRMREFGVDSKDLNPVYDVLGILRAATLETPNAAAAYTRFVNEAGPIATPAKRAAFQMLLSEIYPSFRESRPSFEQQMEVAGRIGSMKGVADIQSNLLRSAASAANGQKQFDEVIRIRGKSSNELGVEDLVSLVTEASRKLDVDDAEHVFHSAMDMATAYNVKLADVIDQLCAKWDASGIVGLKDLQLIARISNSLNQYSKTGYPNDTAKRLHEQLYKLEVRAAVAMENEPNLRASVDDATATRILGRSTGSSSHRFAMERARETFRCVTQIGGLMPGNPTPSSAQ